MSVLEMTRGDRATYRITLTNEDDGSALDLTGMGVTFTARRRPGDDVVLQKTDGDGITVDADPTTGIATLVIDPADTIGFDAPLTLRWDVQVDDGADDVRTPLRGSLIVGPDIT